jgi:hypothetical protein
MVNGIEPNSNRCSLCRTEICEARERRQIADNVDEEGLGGEDKVH